MSTPKECGEKSVRSSKDRESCKETYKDQLS